jgi:rubrerythrin
MDFEHFEEKEAVKKAAMIEENGYTFYSILAHETQDAETKALFQRLAADELKHKKIIENKYFEEAGLGEQITEEELSLEEYIERGHDSDIFTRRIDVKALVKILDHPRKALIVALDTEKYSVRLFTELANNAETEDVKEIYRSLIKEEESHVELIEALLKAAPPL